MNSRGNQNTKKGPNSSIPSRTLGTQLGIFLGLGLALMSGIIACGSNNSNPNNNPAPAPYYYSGVPLPTGLIPNCVGQQCNFGLAGYQRLGFYAQSANFQNGLFLNNGSVLQTTSAIRDFLRDAMGICDRNHADYGYANCAQWINGYHDLVLMMDGSLSNTVRLMFRSYPQVISPYYGYSASFPSLTEFFGTLVGFPMFNYQGFFNPLILQSSIWPINNSKGFEIRSDGPQGSPGYNRLLQLQVASGKVEDERFSFVLQWNGQKIASGTLVRCQTLTCGLPSW